MDTLLKAGNSNQQALNILDARGDIVTIGGGDDFSFTPTFWTFSKLDLSPFPATS